MSDTKEFDYILKRYSGTQQKMLRDAFQQDPYGDRDRVRHAAWLIAKETLGFESPSGREFSPDKRDLEPAEYLQKMKEIIKTGNVEHLWSDDWKALQAIPADDLQARVKLAREKNPDGFKERAGRGVSDFFHPVFLTNEQIDILGDDYTQEDAALTERLRELEARSEKRLQNRRSKTPEDVEEEVEFREKKGRLKELRALARDKEAVGKYEAKLMQQNAWATVMEAKHAVRSGMGREIVDFALDHKGKLDADRLDMFSGLHPEEQREIIPMLHTLREASDGRSWVGDVSRAFVRGVADTPFKAGNYLFNKGAELIYRDADLYQTLVEQASLVELADQAPMRDWGWWGNAVVGVANTLPYMAYASTGVGAVAVIGSAALEMEKRIASEGGDVSSAQAQISAFSAGVAYWSIERLQASNLFGPLEKFGTRKSFLTMASSIRNRAWKDALKAGVGVSAWVGGRTVGETFEESMQAGIEEGYVALRLDRDVAKAMTEGMVEEAGQTFGTMFLLAVTGAGRQTMRYRAGVFETADQKMKAALLSNQLAGKFFSRDYSQGDLQKFGTELGMLFRGWVEADGNASRFAQMFGLDQETANAMAINFSTVYNTLGGDADAMRTALGGRHLLGTQEHVERAMPWMRAETEDDGTVVLRRAEDAPAEVPDVTLRIRKRPASEFELTDDVLMDGKNVGMMMSIIQGILTRGGKMTLEVWMRLSLDERRDYVNRYELWNEGRFEASDSEGNTVTEGDLQALSGTVLLNEHALPGTIFHELFHSVSELLSNSGMIKGDVVKGLRRLFGDPLSGDEQFNEETAAEGLRAYLMGRVSPVSQSLFEQWTASVNQFIDMLAGLRRKEKEETNAYIRFVEAIRTGNLRQVPIVAADVAAKQTPGETTAPATDAAVDTVAPGSSAPDATGTDTVGTDTVAPGSHVPDVDVTEAVTPETQDVDVTPAVTPETLVTDTQAPAAPTKKQTVRPHTTEAAPMEDTRRNPEWSAVTPDGSMRIGGTWAVMDFMDVLTSSDPDYWQPLQGRSRDVVASRLQVHRMARALDPSRLVEAATTDQGAPIVTADGMVLSGNGRVLAIREALHLGTLAAYQEMVRQRAGELGMDISEIVNPVLVRLMPAGMTQQDMMKVSELSNRPSILQRGFVETAEADAKLLSGTEVLGALDTGESGDLSLKSNRMFMNAFIERTGDQSLRLSDGSPSPEAYARVRRAALAAVFEGVPDYRSFLRQIFERGSSEDGVGVKREVDGIMRAAAQLVRLAKMSPDYAINQSLAMAFTRYMNYRNRGGVPSAIEAELAQQDIFADRDPMSDALLRQIGIRHSGALIADLLMDYAARAMAVDPSPDMFGNPPPSPVELLEHAAKATMPVDLEAVQAAEVAKLQALRDQATAAADAFVASEDGQRLGALEANVGSNTQAEEAEREGLAKDLDETVRNSIRGAEVADADVDRIEEGKISEPQARDYLESKHVPATRQAIASVREGVQAVFSFLNDEQQPGDYKTRKKLKGDGKAELAARKNKLKRIFLALTGSPGQDVTANDVNAAFDEGEDVSLILPEFYQHPFSKGWPIAGFRIRRPQDIAALSMQLRSPYQESFRIVYLDKNNVVLDGRVSTVGILNASMVDSRAFFSNMPEGTVSVIVGHNHPSGDPGPSKEDIAATKLVQRAARAVGVHVIDHVITNGSQYYSMREQEELSFDDGYQNKSRRGKRAPAWDPEQLADWEAMPMLDTPLVPAPEFVRIVSDNLRTIDQDAVFIYAGGTRINLLGASKVDANVFGPVGERLRWDHIAETARQIAGKAFEYGYAKGIFLDLPQGFVEDHAEWYRQVESELKDAYGVTMFDALFHVDNGDVFSGRREEMVEKKVGFKTTLAAETDATTLTGESVVTEVVQEARATARDRQSVQAGVSPEQDVEYLSAVNSGDMDTVERMANKARQSANKANIAQPTLPVKDIERIARDSDNMGYPLSENDKKELFSDTVEYLKSKGVDSIDLYHVSSFEDPTSDGIEGTEVSYIGSYDENTRPKSVYAFLDPDDIDSGWNSIMGARDLKNTVVHFKIPVDELYRLNWDSNFNVVNETYSAVAVRGDISKDRIVGRYKYTSPFVDDVTYDDSGNVIPLSERFNAKTSDIRYSVRAGVSAEQDVEYMAAVKAGDEASAQKMVDEAAKRAGYKHLGYHNTDAQFTVFDVDKLKIGTHGFGFYFGRDSMDDWDYGKYVVRAYLKMENPLIISTAEDYQEFKDNGFDTEIGGYDSVIDENPAQTNPIFIVFDPSQIKSADAVTRDDAGRVIPLSERFNEASPDIRHSIRGREGLDVAALPDTMDEAHTVTSVSFLQRLPGYDGAKRGGNALDARAVVNALIGKFDLPRIRAAKADVIVPADTYEEGMKNMIPFALAQRLSEELNIPVLAPSAHSKDGSNTDAPLAVREANAHYFDIEGVAGKRVLIVDDVYTSGDTVLALAAAIQRAGGIPIMVTTLAASQSGKGIRPKSAFIKETLDILGQTEEDFTHEFGFNPNQLSQAYLFRLLRLVRSKRKNEILREHFERFAGRRGRDGEHLSDVRSGGDSSGSVLGSEGRGSVPEVSGEEAQGGLTRNAIHSTPYDEHSNVRAQMMVANVIATDRVKNIKRTDAEYESLAKTWRVDLDAAKQDADRVLNTLKSRRPTFEQVQQALVADKVDALLQQAGKQGEKLAADAATLAQKGLIGAQRAAIEDAPEVALQDFKTETGVDPARDLTTIAPALFDPDYKPQAKKETDTAPGDAGGAVDPDALSEEHQAALEAEKLRRRGAFEAILDRLAAYRAHQDVEREARRAQAEERRKQREAMGERADVKDAADEDGDDDTERFTFPVFEGESAEIRTAGELAYVLRIGVEQWIAKREQRSRERAGQREQVKTAQVFADPVNVAAYRKSMIAILQDITKKWVDPNAAVSYNAIFRAINEMSSNLTANQIEKRTARIVGMIQRAAIRLSRKQMIADLQKDIQVRAIKGKQLDALEKDTNRKVKGEHEAMARFVKNMLDWSPNRCASELEWRMEQINNRTRAYSEDQDSSGLDPADDAEISRWHEQIRVIERWGGMKDMLPGEIAGLGDEIRGWLDKSRVEHLARREEIQKRRDALALAVQMAVTMDPSRPRPQWGKIRKFGDEFTATLRQRLESVMLVRAMSAAERKSAVEAIDSITSMVTKNTQTYLNTSRNYRKQIEHAVQNAVKDTGMSYRKFLKLLDQQIPAELNAQISNPTQGVQMNWGQAAQLYASLRQTQTYMRNINAHDRAAQAELIKEAMPVQVLRFISSMREIYQARRQELSAVQEAATGLDVRNPDPLYMPVQIFRDPHGELDTEFRGWLPIPRAFSPRVPHGLDFDETAHIMSVTQSSMRNTALAVAFAESGLDLRSILARKDTYSAIVRFHGKDAAQGIIRQVTDHLTDGYGQQHGPVDNAIRAVSTLHTYSALSWNFQSGMKQMLSVPAWAGVLEGGLRDVWRNMMNFNRQAARELSESPGFLARYGESSMREVMAEAWRNPSANMLTRFYRAGMTVIQAGDYFPGLLVGTGVYQSRRDALIRQGVDAAEARSRAAVDTWAMIEQSQQSSHPENTPDLLRRRGFYAKQMYKFQSSQVLQFSHEYTAFTQWIYGKGLNRARAKKKFFNVVVANHIIMPIAFTFVGELFRIGLGGVPDDEKEWLKKVKGNLMLEMLTGPFAHIIFFGAITRQLVGAGVKLTGAKPQIYGQSAFPSLDMLDRLQQRGLITMSDMAEGDYESFRDDMIDLLGQLNAPVRYGDRLWWTYVEGEDEKARRKRKQRRSKPKRR